MKEKINRDSLVRKYMRKITMASNASLICCDYGDYGVMVESQGEHYDVIGLLGAFIVMYSQKYGYDTDEIKKEVNSAIEIIKEQEAGIE